MSVRFELGEFEEPATQNPLRSAAIEQPELRGGEETTLVFSTAVPLELCPPRGAQDPGGRIRFFLSIFREAPQIVRARCLHQPEDPAYEQLSFLLHAAIVECYRSLDDGTFMIPGTIFAGEKRMAEFAKALEEKDFSQDLLMRHAAFMSDVALVSVVDEPVLLVPVVKKQINIWILVLLVAMLGALFSTIMGSTEYTIYVVASGCLNVLAVFALIWQWRIIVSAVDALSSTSEKGDEFFQAIVSFLTLPPTSCPTPENLSQGSRFRRSQSISSTRGALSDNFDQSGAYDNSSANFTSTGIYTATSFLVEPEFVSEYKNQIDQVLMDADEDEGAIVVRPRGHTSKAMLQLATMNNHVLIATTDLHGFVTFWNDGAVRLSGFTVREAEGMHVSSFIVGERALQTFDGMLDGARGGVSLAPKALTLANSTYGSVAVIATVCSVTDLSTKLPVGFALVASSSESESSTRPLALWQSYLLQLIQQQHHTQRLPSLAALSWKNISDLAAASKDWTPVVVQSLLGDVVRERHRQVDVKIVLGTPELAVMDGPNTAKVLSLVLHAFSTKVRLEVSHKFITEDMPCLEFRVFFATGTVFPDGAVTEIQRRAMDVGGELREEETLWLLLLPYLAAGSAGAPDFRKMDDTNKTLASKAKTTMTILLLERNAVFKHNLSSYIWAQGHSLRVVDTLQKAMRVAADSSVDLGCAVVDADIRDVQVLLEALASRHIFTLCTSENQVKGKDADKGSVTLTKPVSRQALEAQLLRAASSIEAQKKLEEEIVTQRAVFGKVRNSPWTRGRKLGRGAFADVYEATSTLTGGKMAVKMIRLVGGFDERVKELLNEIQILCSLAHPNIIHYFYCERAETTINLFMELADEGSLGDLLAKTPRLTEEQLANVTRQLLLAVSYLHDANIIHRDIKPGNMLLSHGKIKLTDFGTATWQRGEGTQGTIFYMAPEVIDGVLYGKACDVWSIGCVLCECLQVKRPSRADGLLGFGAPTEYPPHVSASVRNFIELCMQEESTDRATAGTLLIHEFLTGNANDTSLRMTSHAAEAKGGPAAPLAAAAGWKADDEAETKNLSVSSTASW